MNLNVWHFSDYKSFLVMWKKSLKKRDGTLCSLAQFLNVHQSRLTKIIDGTDHPTTEQAFLIAQFLQLGEIESQYFIELVHLDRAGSQIYRSHIQQKLLSLKLKLESPADFVEPTEPLTPADEKLFYSSYRYGAVWLSSMIGTKNDLDSIARNLRLDKKVVKEAADFLIKISLCEWKNGRLCPGSRFLKIDSKSPNLESFLSNWRLHAIQTVPNRSPSDYFYSEPMAVGAEAAVKIKSILDKTVLEIREILVKYPSDEVKCLNIDFFTT